MQAGYQDSRIHWEEMLDLQVHYRAPEQELHLVEDVAPFPVWIVPPGWRLARLSDVAKAIGREVTKELAEALHAVGIGWAEAIDPLGVVG